MKYIKTYEDFTKDLTTVKPAETPGTEKNQAKELTEDKYSNMQENERYMVKLIKKELRLDVKTIGFENDHGDGGDVDFQLHEGPVIYVSSLQGLLKAGKFKDASIHYHAGVVNITLKK